LEELRARGQEKKYPAFTDRRETGTSDFLLLEFSLEKYAYAREEQGVKSIRENTGLSG
jgi:hypothetical protein